MGNGWSSAVDVLYDAEKKRIKTMEFLAVAGTLGTFFFGIWTIIKSRKNNRVLSGKLESVQNELNSSNSQNAELQKELRRQAKKLIFEEGAHLLKHELHEFESIVTNVAEAAEHDFRLVCSTPLLGSLKEDEPKVYQSHSKSIVGWQENFCVPFIEALKRNEKALDIKVVHLETLRLKELLSLLKNNHMPSSEHLHSIDSFFEDVAANNQGRRPSISFATSVPFYMALRDVELYSREDAPNTPECELETYDPGEGELPAPLGCVAFISPDILIGDLYKGEAAEDIAKELITFQFWSSDILKYLAKTFDNLHLGAANGRGFLETIIRQASQGMYDIALVGKNVHLAHFDGGKIPDFSEFTPEDNRLCEFEETARCLKTFGRLSQDAYDSLRIQFQGCKQCQTAIGEIEEFWNSAEDHWDCTEIQFSKRRAIEGA